MLLPDPKFWFGKKVFLTGHTGFKGSWLTIWLEYMGAKVHGFSLAPDSEPNFYTEASLSDYVESTFGDIRNIDLLRSSMLKFDPDILIHMAAQPLVRRSYTSPVDTYSVNVMGTVNVLQIARELSRLKAVINVTTDKCYENNEWHWPYREIEPMGGHDPYSSSKACSELVTAAYTKSYFNESHTSVASARAGNVIGGGDWAQDRLVPDILRAFSANEKLKIRYPNAIRPWQHVLEPLSGYLILAQALYLGDKSFQGGWNFGPNDTDAKPVSWIVGNIAQNWRHEVLWETDNAQHMPEAHYLKLDISKARNLLNWQPRWNLELAIKQVVSWHDRWADGENMKTFTIAQIEEYIGK